VFICATEAVRRSRTTKASSYADIEHKVKEWIKLAAESDGGLHQEDRRAFCTAVGN